MGTSEGQTPFALLERGGRVELAGDRPIDVSLVSEVGFRYAFSRVLPYWPYTARPWDCGRIIWVDGGTVDVFSPPSGSFSIRLERPREPGGSVRGERGGARLAPSGTMSSMGRIPEVVVDVAVIGAGVSGLSAALAASEYGLSVLLLDFSDVPGGYLSALWSPSEVDPARSSAEAVAELYSLLMRRPPVRILLRTEYLAYLGPWRILARSPEGLLVVRSRAIIYATGGLDSRPVFPGNWLPGIVSSDYILRLAHHGIHFRSVAVVGWNDWTLRVAGHLASRYADRVVIVSKNHLPPGLKYVEYASRYGVELVVDKIVEASPTSEGIRLDFREYESIEVDAVVSTIGPYPEPLTPAMAGSGLHYSESLKAVLPRMSEVHHLKGVDRVYVVGLAAGEVSEYASYHGGRLVGTAVAADLGRADESDVKAGIVELMKDPQAADLIVELRQGPQAAPPSEPEMFMAPGIASGEYVDVCSGVELALLEPLLRRLKDLGPAVEASGILYGVDGGRESLQALVQFSSMILGRSPSSLNLDVIPTPLFAGPLNLGDLLAHELPGEEHV